MQRLAAGKVLSETGILRVARRSQTDSEAAGVVKVPGRFLKSTVLLCRKHGDPGRAGFESEISFCVLLKFCT